ncbi:MAG: orotidine-5'-phosphate decarboxylase [Ardenticatenales bacterium]
MVTPFATAGATGHAAAAMPSPPPPSFNARLDAAIDREGSLLCVGLDPRMERLEEPIEDFCRRIIDATIHAAVAFKPNSAFFEQLGVKGWQALEIVVRHIGGARVVILDAKRGDIGPTAEAYAHAAFRALGVDAITVNPYLGGDAVLPFLADPERGGFILCHTSNPGAQDFQTLPIDGRPLYLHVAERVAAAWNGADNAGLVLGATYPDALEAVRERAPRLPFLVPGIGAQGGDLGAALAAGLDANGRGLVINSSREIVYAGDPADAALRLRDAINAARARYR